MCGWSSQRKTEGDTYISQRNLHQNALHSLGIAASSHKFKAFSNLDGDFDVPEEKLEAVTAFIQQQIAGVS